MYMHNPTLSKEELLSLSVKQREVISSYYNLLINSPHTPPDIEEVCTLWEIAEADPQICKWLEFIDFFFIPSSDNDSLLSDDTRAFLSEYISVLHFQKHFQEHSDDSDVEISNLLSSFRTLSLSCSKEQDSFAVTNTVVLSDQWNDFIQKRCPQCDRPFSEHDIRFSE